LKVVGSLCKATPGGKGGDVELVAAKGETTVAERRRELFEEWGGSRVGVGDEVGGGEHFRVEVF
jgi:hypothetical protein